MTDAQREKRNRHRNHPCPKCGQFKFNCYPHPVSAPLWKCMNRDCRYQFIGKNPDFEKGLLAKEARKNKSNHSVSREPVVEKPKVVEHLPKKREEPATAPSLGWSDGYYGNR